jgi:endonuclease VIII
VPEGDTIHRAAALLRPALHRRQLLRFEAPRLVGDRPRAAETIEGVEAVGKHLLVHFSGGLTLETHLRMTGSWHLYRTGERWRKPPYLMRCLIAVADHQAVCFSAPVVRTFPTARRGTRQDPTAHLGPDLCLPTSDADEVVAACVARMDPLDPRLPIGEVLLDQRVGNGIGNVYKSEVCWHCGVDPFAPLTTVSPEERTRLIANAGRLLRANLGPGRRRTVAEGLAVYGRRGRPCRRCGTAIRRNTEGELARVTFWCPTCQPSRRVQASGT